MTAKHVMTCNSGSSANLLAFMALTSPTLGIRRIVPGDEVITVAAGFPTTVNPILMAGCIPVFVDVTIPEYNIDVSQLEMAYSSKTRAVMIAHTLGRPFNVRAVKDFCDDHGLWLVEDCADALGGHVDGQHVGTFGDIGTLSFYPAHHITTGEGGAVFTNSGRLKPVIESFRDWGRDCFCEPGKDNTCGKRYQWQLGDLPYGYDHKYCYSHLGYNLKITDMQAACGVAQMERVEGFVSHRRRNYRRLADGLSDLHAHLRVAPLVEGMSPFGVPITVAEHVDRADFIHYLNDGEIDSRLLFGGNLTKQPYMKGRNFRIVGALENTDTIMARTLWLGCWPGLNDIHIDYMLGAIHEFFHS